MRTRDQTHRAPVLAAYSPDTGAREPVEFGVAASRVTGAPLVIVVVVDSGAQSVRPLTDKESVPTSIADAVKHLEGELADRGVAAEVRTFEDSTAARGLARAIDECGPELVVLGTTSRGAKGALLLGTTAERVIHLSPCPVAVVPHGYQRPEGGVKVVGAAYTPKPEAEDALVAAITLARSGGVELRVLTVLDPKFAQEEAHGLMAEHRREVGTDAKLASRVRYDLETQTKARVTELAGDLPATVDVITDEPVRALVAASAHVDLLVMGSRALGTRRAVILGSVSRKVIDESSCPVIVIPRDTTAKRDELLADVEEHAPQAG
ncbi:universal stress protein [Solirubrobacter taibaiensis]|nr:universal stress protein [Solirubrobacter taibaiensis]